ncbi:uncharacterized protein LY89DRAFT_669042 [Mollisia scopiformis]|uniref:Zn(2)-C6 fungal-type domain-containing protein n=1 Tax=Mollisia scopiformis TaxID=149040 RepID=A0A194XC66_MOLSC|nr:uncharacterized protein LY89DRAFT_669042 [Mollisia scopiformis]KUJ17751.1 hypothetical protein LY89DRAFT_669042 [Mollisia scopiformis]
MTNQGITKTRHERKRVFAPKSRSGCLSCRKRRIKCDERRPQCEKCAKSGFSCDGYLNSSKLVPKKARLHKIAPKQSIAPKPAPTSSDCIPIPTLKQWTSCGGGLLLQPRNTLFGSEKEARYFRVFCDNVAIQLSGFYDLPLWNRLILQTAEQEESVRHGIISIGALQQTIDLRSQQDGRYIAPLTALDEHHRFAIEQYSKAIKQMRDAVATQKHQLRTTLLTCLLIICFESLHGNHESAITQMQIGIHLLEDFISSQRQAITGPIRTKNPKSTETGHLNVPPFNESTDFPSFALHSPAPDIIEDDLVQAFARLDMQSNSFIDSRPIEYHMAMKDYGLDCIVRMPKVFSSMHEARKYYELVMRRLMHWISSVYHRGGKDTTKKGNLHSANEAIPRNDWILDVEGEEGGILNRENPPSQDVTPATYEEKQMHLNELELWWHAFTPLLNNYRPHTDTKEYLCSTSLQLRFTATRFALSTTLNTDQMVYDKRIDEVKQVIRLAKILHSHPSVKGQFTFDLGYIPQLYVMAIKCRHRTIRREAIHLLLSRVWREGVWDSVLAGRMATSLMEVEEQGIKGEYIPNEARVKGTKMKFDLQKREGHLTCFMVGGPVVKRTIRW